MIGDIVGWVHLKPITFEAFRAIQAAALATGWRTYSDGENLQFRCSACAGRLISIGIASPEDRSLARDFDVCYTCWQVVEHVPILEGHRHLLTTEQRVQFLEALTPEQRDQVAAGVAVLIWQDSQ